MVFSFRHPRKICPHVSDDLIGSKLAPASSENCELMVCFIIEEHEVKEGGFGTEAAYIVYWDLRLASVKPRSSCI